MRSTFLLCFFVLLLTSQGFAASAPGDTSTEQVPNTWFTVPTSHRRPATRTLPPDPGHLSTGMSPAGNDRLSVLDTFAPFYRIGDDSMGIDEHLLVEIEAGKRPVFSVTSPFQHVEVPLPPGNWTVVSLVTERSTDDGPAGIGTVLARLEGHVVTGVVLIRGSDRAKPGSLSSLPPDRFCTDPGRYAAGRVSAAGDGRDFCWFVSEETDPTLMWTLPDMPPVLRLAVGTLAATHDILPRTLVGATIARIDGARWIEITTFLDPSRSGVSDPHGVRLPAAKALADPQMRMFVERMARWTRQRTSLVAHLSSNRRSADEVGGINFDAPP